MLVLSDRYLPDKTGTSLRIARLAQPLVNSEWHGEIHVATLNAFIPSDNSIGVKPPANEELSGVHVHRFTSETSMMIGLARLHRRHQFTIVHARGIRNGLYARVLCTLFSIPSIVELNSVNPQSNLLKRKLWEYALLSPDRLIVLTESARDWLTSEFKLPQDKIDVVMNGVDLEQFRIADRCIKNELGLEDNLVVGYAGTFLEWQGVFEFVRVARVVAEQHPGSHFLMVGDGPAFGKTQSLVESSGIAERFTFTGLVEPAEVPTYLQAMDVVLLARPPQFLKNQLASPLKLFEAMAMKRAIVVTSVRGLDDVIVDRETGLVVDPDTEEIARAVVTLLEDRELRRQLGKAAFEAVQAHHSWEAAAFDLAKSYEKAFG